VQQAGDVTAVVLNLAALVDDFGHAGGGPQFGRKAIGHGPFISRLIMRWRCALFSSGGLPGVGRTFKASLPPSVRASRQRITELGAQSVMRPTSASV
jgi:hypothetical protein